MKLLKNFEPVLMHFQNLVSKTSHGLTVQTYFSRKCLMISKKASFYFRNGNSLLCHSIAKIIVNVALARCKVTESRTVLQVRVLFVIYAS